MDAIEDIIEARLAVIRKGWQKQALEKIKEAEARGYERGCADQPLAPPPGAPAQADPLLADTTAKLVADAEARGLQRGLDQGAQQVWERVEEARAEAEARGEARGVARAKAALSEHKDEARRWQAVAEAYLPSPSGGQPALLLKYIMEQVYRETKREFREGEGEAIARVKGVLHAANDVLAGRLPLLLIPPAPAAAPASAPVPAPVPALNALAARATPLPIPTAPPPTPTPNPPITPTPTFPIRACKFCLGSVAPALSELVLVEIPSTQVC